MTITLTGRIIRHKGGEGSGFHGHSGRPGEVGGSAAVSIDIKSLKFDLSKLHESNRIVDKIGNFGAYWILSNGTVIKANGGHVEAALDLIRSTGVDPEDLRYTETHSKGDLYEYNIMFDLGAIRIEQYGDLQLETSKIDTSTLRKIKKLINNGIIPYVAYDNDVNWSAGSESIMHMKMQDIIEANEVTTEIQHFYRPVDIRDLSKKIDIPHPMYVLKQVLTGRIINKGGEGSGNFQHSGRPGLVGGSQGEQDYVGSNWGHLNGLLLGWAVAEEAGDSRVDALRFAAQNVFGNGIDQSKVAYYKRAAYGMDTADLEDAMHKEYLYTQSKLRQDYPDGYVTLYRALHNIYDEHKYPMQGNVTINDAILSSWSSSKEGSLKAIEYWGKSMGYRLLETRVPIADIFIYPGSAMSMRRQGENEFIVINKAPREATIIDSEAYVVKQLTGKLLSKQNHDIP